MAHFFNFRRNYTPRVYYSDNFAQQPHEMYRDFELRRKYKFGNDSINYFTELFREHLERPTQRSHALTVRTQILITLRFLATGAHYDLICENFGVHRSTVCKVIWDVIPLFLMMKDDLIFIPQEENDVQSIENGFQRMAGFPNVIGCVDGPPCNLPFPVRF